MAVAGPSAINWRTGREKHGKSLVSTRGKIGRMSITFAPGYADVRGQDRLPRGSFMLQSTRSCSSRASPPLPQYLASFVILIRTCLVPAKSLKISSTKRKSNMKRKHYLLASDFDQTLSFNDS